MHKSDQRYLYWMVYVTGILRINYKSLALPFIWLFASNSRSQLCLALMTTQNAVACMCDTQYCNTVRLGLMCIFFWLFLADFLQYKSLLMILREQCKKCVVIIN